MNLYVQNSREGCDLVSASLSTTARWTISAILGVVPLLCMAQTTRDGRIDLGGYQLYISESGSGVPAVVFESGLGEDLARGAMYNHRLRYLPVLWPMIARDLASPTPLLTPKPFQRGVRTTLSVACRQSSASLCTRGHSLGGAIVQVLRIHIQRKLQD